MLSIPRRVGKEGTVCEQFNAPLKNGSASSTQQTYAQESAYQGFQTRIISNAEQVNFAFETVKPRLEAGLVKVIVGIF